MQLPKRVLIPTGVASPSVLTAFSVTYQVGLTALCKQLPYSSDLFPAKQNGGVRLELKWIGWERLHGAMRLPANLVLCIPIVTPLFGVRKCVHIVALGVLVITLEH